MTKPRAYLSIEQALGRIADTVGWDAMAATVARCARTVRAWSEPDRPECVSLADAGRLDAAYRQAGGMGAPLHEAMGHLIDSACRDAYADSDELALRAVRCIKEGADANAALVRASLPGATDRDRADAIREVEEDIAELRGTLPVLLRGAGLRSASCVGDVP